MFGLLVDCEIQDGAMHAFLPLILENARRSVQDEPGCRQFDVSRVEGQPNRLVLYELYADEAAFEAHGNSPHLAAFIAKGRPMIVKATRTRMTVTGANCKR